VIVANVGAETLGHQGIENEGAGVENRPGLRAPLERQRKLQAVLLEHRPVREDLRRRTVRDHPALSDHDAAFTDIEDQVEVVGGDDLGMLEGL
jgi:hypothetical protein